MTEEPGVPEMKLTLIRKITVSAAMAIVILLITPSNAYPASVGSPVSQGSFELGASCSVSPGQFDPLGDNAGAGLDADTIVFQWPRGGTPGIPDVEGVIELRLFNLESGETLLRARGKAEGDGLTDNALYSLWLADQEGHSVLTVSGRAKLKCEVDSDSEEEEGDECVVELRLRNPGLLAPFEVTTLLGLTATIREGLGSVGSIGALEQAPVVIGFTVTEADLLTRVLTVGDMRGDR